MLAPRSITNSLAAALLLCVAVTPSFGQNAANHWHDANAQELLGHRLTLEEVRRTIQAESAMAKAAKASPQDFGSYDYDESEVPQIDDVAGKVSRSPQQLVVLQKYGFTARTFALAEATFVQTGLARTLLRGGSSMQYVEDVFCASSQNIQFFKTNEPTLRALFSQFSGGADITKDSPPKATNHPSSKQ
jgi:hypothetical protein